MKTSALIITTAMILAAFSCTNRANENENAPAVERNDSLVLTADLSQHYRITITGDSLWYDYDPFDTCCEMDSLSWPPEVKEFDSQKFINKYKPLIDTIKTPIGHDFVILDDICIDLYYNGKLIVSTYGDALSALPKPFHDMILDIIGQAGGLYGFTYNIGGA